MSTLAIKGGEPYKKKEFPKWPKHDEREIELITEVVNSGNWWRMSGDKVETFEKKFAELQGTKYCLGVTSGTHAIELSLSALGIGKGDEVIVPAFTFISTASAVIYCNATPILVDVDSETFCMIPEAFEKAITPKTKAVIPVHMAGHACDMDKICDIAKKHGIKVIEDAAHGHGGEWNKKRLGSMGDISIFSFQNGKLMTCGEGGCVVTNSKELYDEAFLMHGVGRPKYDRLYQHLVIGSNYRMSEFHAAILLAQMERIESMNKIREENAVYLDRLLKEVEGIKPQGRRKEATIITHYMYMFYYDSNAFNGLSRQDFVDAMIAEGISAFISFPVLSDTIFFNEQNFGKRIEAYDYENEADLTNARRIAKDVVWLPHSTLDGDKQDIEDIVGAIKKIQNCVRR